MRRRRTAAGSVPKAIADWFAGDFIGTRADGAPWVTLTFPGSALLPDWWAGYKAAHPAARPPASHQWLDDPAHPRHRVYGRALVAARRRLGRADAP